MQKALYFVLPLIVSAIIIPFAKIAGDKCDIVAQVNDRTVHKATMWRNRDLCCLYVGNGIIYEGRPSDECINYWRLYRLFLWFVR